jgi:LacI family transcriptional regulator
MANRITMHDVAQAAGVSLMTVSRVVNNKDDVNLATRKRVTEVIEELGYRPSNIARGLATRRTGTLGVIVPDISNPLFASIVRSAEEEAYAKGYSVFLGNTNEDPERELAVLQSMEDFQVDGLILYSSRLEDDTLFKVLARFTTSVLVFREGKGSDVGAFTVDDVFGGQAATKHLLNSGHHNIGLISGPPISLSAFGRIKGYQTALQAADIPVNEDWIRHCHPVVERGQDTAYDLLKNNSEITALFCHNDLVAVGALQACKELRLRVPDDIAIIGYDDIHLAALVSPALTTVHIPMDEIGTRTMQMLLEQVEAKTTEPKKVHLQPTLIVRESAP